VRRALALAVLAALFAAMTVACGRPEPVRSAPDECATTRPLPVGSTERTMTSGGVSRQYLMRVPPGYDGTRRTPVVMLFHGLGGAPKAVVETTGMGRLADQKGAILVAPLGRGTVSKWDFRTPISTPTSDLAFVRDLVAEVKGEACVDGAQLFAAGFSNGSALTLALACDGSTRFAGYGAVSGPYWDTSCEHAPPASVIYFHGLRDTVVPYGGARTSIGRLPPVNDIMASWASHDGCPPASATTTVSDNVRHFAWTACRAGSAVDVYIVDDGGHRWPGGTQASAGQTTTAVGPDLDASTLMWEFFERHAAGGQ
jgi:polyhydroxybutyrate depolymerase